MRSKANAGHVEWIITLHRGHRLRCHCLKQAECKTCLLTEGTAVLHVFIYSRYHYQIRSPGQFADQGVLCRASPASQGGTQCHYPQTTCFEVAFKGTGRSASDSPLRVPGTAHGHPFSTRETGNSWRRSSGGQQR